MFLNPFAKKIRRKKKPEVKSKVIADIHEKNSLVIAELSNKEVELEIKPLKIGDYLIGNTVIERKTASDFISSMLNKRLLEQLGQMQRYENRLLIIEGQIEISKNSKLNPNAVRGFILSIINHHKIPVIFTQDYEDTAYYLITLAKQQLKKKIKSTLHSRIPSSLKEQKQYILEAFPNIGPVKAEKLLEKFKTLKQVFNSSEEELREVLKNQSKNFKEVLEN